MFLASDSDFSTDGFSVGTLADAEWADIVARDEADREWASLTAGLDGWDDDFSDEWDESSEWDVDPMG